MQTQLVPFWLHGLKLIVTRLSSYAPLLSLLWLAPLFWKPTARLFIVRAVGAMAILDLLLKGLALAGAAANLTTLHILTIPLGSVLLASTLLAAVVVPLQLQQDRRAHLAAKDSAQMASAVRAQPVVAPAIQHQRLEGAADAYSALQMVTVPRLRVAGSGRESSPAGHDAHALTATDAPGIVLPTHTPQMSSAPQAIPGQPFTYGDMSDASAQARAQAMGLSVIVPVYNERDTIVSLIARVIEQPIVTEVVIVNDGSTDGTTELLEHIRWPKSVRLLRHAVNQGKGAAIRTGIAAATQDIIIVQDADLEYDPGDYPAVLRPIWEERADVVYGSRFLTPRPFAFWLDLANRLLTFATNVLYSARLTDMETCYKAFRSDVLKSVTIISNRFDFEPEITAKILRQRRRIVEVPIRYERRAYASGKKIHLGDAFTAVRALVRFRFGQL